ncbi:hypothetical protein [Roseateles sp. BYS96W]|uniref:Uncharacterized protein n=1 Tax=Pelomonas nitida TaxID=3299027 RepID=A0ABW7GA24_9BURK
MRMMFRTALAALLATGASLVHAAPLACMQEGVIQPIPPVYLKPITLKECTDFTGPEAAAVADAWCDSASKMTLTPKDTPPKVTRLASCPAGALAVCRFSAPGGQVRIGRHFFTADPATGGIENLRKMCLQSASSNPEFTVLKP